MVARIERSEIRGGVAAYESAPGFRFAQSGLQSNLSQAHERINPRLTMDLRFTPDEIAFRDEVRAFMRTALPAPIRRKMVEARRLDKHDIVTWQRILNAKGWAVPHWPAAWGGTGWSPVKQYIFHEEL